MNFYLTKTVFAHHSELWGTKIVTREQFDYADKQIRQRIVHIKSDMEVLSYEHKCLQRWQKQMNKWRIKNEQTVAE